jgi:YVTN family beta-propeller protein
MDHRPCRDRKAAVTAKIKTGIRIGELIDGVPAVGGSSPNSIIATDQYVFVSNGNNDCISVINARTNALLNNIPLNPEPRLKNLRGVIPLAWRYLLIRRDCLLQRLELMQWQLLI